MENIDFYRHETLHTAWLVQEMFNNHVADSFYAKTVKNPTLQQAIEKAQLALGEVYQAINEDNEQTAKKSDTFTIKGMITEPTNRYSL